MSVARRYKVYDKNGTLILQGVKSKEIEETIGIKAKMVSQCANRYVRSGCWHNKYRIDYDYETEKSLGIDAKPPKGNDSGA
ncbi:MAG: hypothetical protein LUF92_02150 [Clostridiales bacterium]|nr:hypothetical protein [Clostridiales bacterium]